MLWLSSFKNAKVIIKYCVQKYCTKGLVERGLNQTCSMERLDILYFSKNFILINKDYDVYINNSDPTQTRTLSKQLSIEYPHLVIPSLQHSFYFCHRLDFATSGVICIALNKKACIAASQAFETMCTEKYYLALVRGHVKQDIIAVNIPVGKDEHEDREDGNHRMKVAGPHCLKARQAFTKMLVLERGMYLSNPATKVLLRLYTGRRHQIRVHCAYLGHTIVGDYTYSDRKDILPPRMFLHAYRLVIPNEIEHIDVQTADPFTRESLQETWIPTETVHPLNEHTMEIIEKGDFYTVTLHSKQEDDVSVSAVT